MEYFDFEGASSAHGSSNHQDDDVASVDIEFDDADEREANFDALLEDQPLEYPSDPLATAALAQPVQPDTAVYPMTRAQEPCDFCRRMGFDCFIMNRGVMQHGCTCCISLYRECSFTHTKAPGKFLDTLHTVSENVLTETGGLTGKRALKSVSYGSRADDPDSRSRKSNARLSRRAVNVLKSWLRDHHENPYPTEQEKDDLKGNTGLTRTQISNWLANARRRGKVRSGTNSPVPGAVDIPNTRPVDVSLMTPLERWEYSPPSTNRPRSAILVALWPIHPSNPLRAVVTTNDSSHASSEHKIHSASASSLETSHSSLSDFSFASAFSHRSSRGSFTSMDRKERRRRRKASGPINTFNQHKAKAVRPYQCTFCTDSFPAKYDWQRHEKSMHLVLEKWTCSPHGGIINDNGTSRCVFCLMDNPDSQHLETHDYMSCQEKTIQERTFYRKDHLNQHLRLMHHAKFQSPMETWRSTINDIKSRCGFCGTSFNTWKDRVDHLAGHFKNGALMAQWQGDWGFDRAIMSRVENAIPPYMIDYEWRSLNPWTTAQAQEDGSTPNLNVPDDANCYMRLSRELAEYIHKQVAQGVRPTDQMLQAEARRVIYGSDDPWNQTCADNGLWLGVLKRDTGLDTSMDINDINFADLGMQPPFALQGGLHATPQDTNILARAVCQGSFNTSGVSSPSIKSPAYPGTGFSPAVHSGAGSLSGSYAGSTGVISAGAEPSLSTDWGGSFPTQPSSAFPTQPSSAPGGGPADPLVQMGFDPAFLQRLNDNYSKINLDDVEGLQSDGAQKFNDHVEGQE
ncbi:hypothetical protein N7510_001408 [Penicillium lagena]|uniref:uncharacterized protein n=1 Tax=Penicillium lagena TaxID=94218 RepID=UPI002541BE5B|nr:uncharacterized protein N7510_001408 [Penicillium lagena]KAJ5625099.1 hypothetical protein N7510_001408 [Penicillium lagena]